VGELIGSGDTQECGIVGETPDLAARLQSVAEPMAPTILCSKADKVAAGSPNARCNRPFDRQPYLSPPSVAHRIHRLLIGIGIESWPPHTKNPSEIAPRKPAKMAGLQHRK
jgi:hypothetical protein